MPNRLETDDLTRIIATQWELKEISKDPQIKRTIKDIAELYHLQISIAPSVDKSWCVVIIITDQNEANFAQRMDGATRSELPLSEIMTLFRSNQLVAYLNQLIINLVTAEPSDTASKMMDLLNKRSSK